MVYLGKTIENVLHMGADGEAIRNAQYLRRNMTEAEKIMWRSLRNRQVAGLKFRRQHALRYYVADFYCHEQRLVIEIDGGIHHKESIKEHDENRTAELDRLGVRVLRFTNDQVIQNPDNVINEIKCYIEDPVNRIDWKYSSSVLVNSTQTPAPSPEGASPHPPAPSPQGEGENPEE